MPSTHRPLAVVTGASSGIGLELARQFTDHGFDLLAAADGPDVEDVRALGTDGASVETIQVDLATDEGVDALYLRIHALGRPVDALALNAGVAAGGAFASPIPGEATALEDELEIVAVNVRSVVHLAKHVLGDMVARGKGRVLLTSSIEATMPGSYQAVYSGSKSFVQAFGLALREELKDTGVTLTLLMPGPVDTDLFAKAGMMDTRVGRMRGKDDPAEVARQGFEALMGGDERVVAASLASKAVGRAGRFVPDRAKSALHAVLSAPGTAGRH